MKETVNVNIGSQAFTLDEDAYRVLRNYLEDIRSRLPEIPFAVAGSCDGMPEVADRAPANVHFYGFLRGEELRRAYLDARIILVPSKWYEGFPNVIVMGMMLERPIITAAIGATGSSIADGVDGLLCQPGDAAALREKIAELYPDVERCREMGKHGRKQAENLYSREMIYRTLEHIYQEAEHHNAER